MQDGELGEKSPGRRVRLARPANVKTDRCGQQLVRNWSGGMAKLTTDVAKLPMDATDPKRNRLPRN
jgi:hypothetical protein